VRVLVVEDMPRYANRIAEGLRDQGIAVDVAYDGHEGAAKVGLNPYDVVILDAKPFHFPELVLRIHALARRKPTAQPRTLQAAGVELDPRTGTVTRDGRSINVTAKERAVLEALLRASPSALSSERLLEQAWDENVDPFTNTVKVTIARLRRKLGRPDIIHTTPGVGYRIAPGPDYRRLPDSG